jgi:glycogen debranching enzyme
MAYHSGSVWLYDNALIALGLACYRMVDRAMQISTGEFQAGICFVLHRMPEPLCGSPHAPRGGTGP